jgi:hypothetical protein
LERQLEEGQVVPNEQRMVHEGGRTWTSCGWVEGGVEEVRTSETRRNSEDVAGEAER